MHFPACFTTFKVIKRTSFSIQLDLQPSLTFRLNKKTSKTTSKFSENCWVLKFVSWIQLNIFCRSVGVVGDVKNGVLRISLIVRIRDWLLFKLRKLFFTSNFGVGEDDEGRCGFFCRGVGSFCLFNLIFWWAICSHFGHIYILFSLDYQV